jgi:hypothetical protein
MIDFQTGVDFIPLLPMVSLFAALPLREITKIISKNLSKRFQLTQNKSTNIARLIVLILICSYGFFPILQPVYPENPIIREGKKLTGRHVNIIELFFGIASELSEKFGLGRLIYLSMFRRMGEQTTITEQQKVAKIVEDNTLEDDGILSLDVSEIVFLSKRRNINQDPSLFYTFAKEPGGVENICENIIMERPKIIVAKSEGVIDILQIRDCMGDDYELMSSPSPEYVLYRLVIK